jgi:ferric-dicitrate binding protein FerR (iron transport regulator)
MRKTATLVLAVIFVATGVAVAADMEGKIQTVDSMNKEVVLDDGTKLALDENTQIVIEGKTGNLEDLKEGSKVKASSQEKDGKIVATLLEVTE